MPQLHSLLSINRCECFKRYSLSSATAFGSRQRHRANAGHQTLERQHNWAVLSGNILMRRVEQMRNGEWHWPKTKLRGYSKLYSTCVRIACARSALVGADGNGCNGKKIDTFFVFVFVFMSSLNLFFLLLFLLFLSSCMHWLFHSFFILFFVTFNADENKNSDKLKIQQ